MHKDWSNITIDIVEIEIGDLVINLNNEAYIGIILGRDRNKLKIKAWNGSEWCTITRNNDISFRMYYRIIKNEKQIDSNM